MSIQSNKVTNISNVISLKSSSHVDELVINWHITEACNYDCTYCFAKWDKPKELHRSSAAVDELLENMAEYFVRGNSLLKQKLNYQNVRLNFAGGEPMLLGNKLSKILVLAKQKGFKTSLITNGSFLLNDKFELPKNVLDMFGISFDSQDFDVRAEIGRIDRKGNSLSSDDLKLAFKKLFKTQNGLKIKINTVINQLNYQEDFSDLISEIKPYKWKVFQVMPYGSEELLITSEQFNRFVKNHNQLGLPMFAESNAEMTESYIMVDPKGRFYQNSPSGSDYIFSKCINDVGTEKALKQINFNPLTFVARYSLIETVAFIDERAGL